MHGLLRVQLRCSRGIAVSGRYEPLNSDAFNADKTVNAQGAESTTGPESHRPTRNSLGTVSARMGDGRGESLGVISAA
jgi:hypothetical protein